jgi:hypothetical protein
MESNAEVIREYNNARQEKLRMGDKVLRAHAFDRLPGEPLEEFRMRFFGVDYIYYDNKILLFDKHKIVIKVYTVPER